MHAVARLLPVLQFYTGLIYSCNARCDLIDFDCKVLFRQLCKMAILAQLDYDEISFSMCFHLLHIFVATCR